MVVTECLKNRKLNRDLLLEKRDLKDAEQVSKMDQENKTKAPIRPGDTSLILNGIRADILFKDIRYNIQLLLRKFQKEFI